MDLGPAESGDGEEGEGFLNQIPGIFVSLGLLFPWMTRDYILWKMTIQEVLMYYVLGTEQHLKLHGLYVPPERTTEKTREISESMSHEQIYNYYHNLQYDESTFKDLM